MPRCSAVRSLTRIVGVLVGVNAALAAPDAAPRHYYHFQDVISVDVDTTRVFVRGASQSDIEAALARSGMERATVTPQPVAQWYEATLPATALAGAGVETVLQNMARDAALQFVSPVLVDETGLEAGVTGDFFVRFTEDVPPAQAEALLAALDCGTIVQRDYAGAPGVYHVQSQARDGLTLLDQTNLLSQLPEVAFASPNFLVRGRLALTPNDPLYPSQWALHNTGQSGGVVDADIDAPEAWDITQGDPNIIVAVLDTGVQQNHPDLNQITGYDATGGGTDGGPGNTCDKHGTVVAGCISPKMNNGIGVAGPAPACRVVSVRIGVSNVPCSNSFTGLSADLVAGIGWAQSIGARVTNASFSWFNDATVTNQYTLTRNFGNMVHFAASGNDGAGSVSYPASLSVINAVGNLTRFNQRASSSNYGIALDFIAPGTDIWSTDRTGSAGYGSGDYVSETGTSFAAPIAAGVAALVVSRNPAFSPDDVETIMKETAVDLGAVGFDNFYGWGRVNAQAALILAGTVPGNFNLTSPANNATGVAPLPTFQWTAATNVRRYRLKLDTVPTFDSPNLRVVNDLTTNSHTLTGNPLQEGITYYWTVAAINFGGTVVGNPASASFTTFRDCNTNSIDDAIDLANCTGQPWCSDCNGNGTLDTCDLVGHFSAASALLSPLGGQDQIFTLSDPRDATGNVTLTFYAKGDLAFANETVTVYLNNTQVDVIYGGVFACFPDQMDQTIVPAATWNAIRAGGPVEIKMTPSAAVNPAACSGDNWIRVEVDYAAVPASADANGNQIPDECEAPPVCKGDTNCDGVVTFKDIDAFVARLGCPGSNPSACNSGCSWQHADVNGDGSVTFKDIDPFVARLGAICP